MSKTENQSPQQGNLGMEQHNAPSPTKNRTGLPNTFHTTTARSFCPTSLSSTTERIGKLFYLP